MMFQWYPIFYRQHSIKKLKKKSFSIAFIEQLLCLKINSNVYFRETIEVAHMSFPSEKLTASRLMGFNKSFPRKHKSCQKLICRRLCSKESVFVFFAILSKQSHTGGRACFNYFPNWNTLGAQIIEARKAIATFLTLDVWEVTFSPPCIKKYRYSTSRLIVFLSCFSSSGDGLFCYFL